MHWSKLYYFTIPLQNTQLLNENVKAMIGKEKIGLLLQPSLGRTVFVSISWEKQHN